MPSQQHSPTTPKYTGRQPDDDYNRRAQAHHREYTAAWNQWWDSLTQDERDEATKLGLDEPLQDSSRASGHAPGEDRDAAESPLARTGFDFKAVEAPVSAAAPNTSNAWLHSDVAVTMQRVVGMLISSDNAKVSVIALAFAMNLDALNGLGSIREAARKIGLSPEALSKKKREWERELDIPPNAFAKSDAAKRALSIAQQTKHWKNARWISLPKKPCKP
jgi:hypothetical protein